MNIQDFCAFLIVESHTWRIRKILSFREVWDAFFFNYSQNLLIFNHLKNMENFAVIKKKLQTI